MQNPTELLIDNTKQLKKWSYKYQKEFKSFTKVIRLAKPYTVIIILSLSATFADVAFNIFFSWLQQTFIDTVNTSDSEKLISILKSTSVISFLIYLVIFSGGYISKKFSFMLSRDMELTVFKHINILPFNIFQKMHSADIVARCTADAQQTAGLMTYHLYGVTYNILMLITSFYYLSRSNFLLAILVVAVGPLVFLTRCFFDGKLMVLSRKCGDKDAEVRGVLQEILQGMHIIKVFGLESIFGSKYQKSRIEQRDLQIRYSMLGMIMNETIGIISSLFKILAIFFMSMEAINGRLSVGTVLAFNYLIGLMQMPISNLAYAWGAIKQGLGRAGRVFEILEAQAEGTKNIEIGGSDEEIVFENAGFSYDGERSSKEQVLNNLNLTIKKGETVAVVGPSGCGKTTLARLCCGLFNVNSGDVRVFGKSVYSNLDEVRGLISYVPQNPYIFPGTIKENILLGCQGASEAEIIEASKLAGAHEFIENLPGKYDTVINENGNMLSGGEKQRIAIARAFLKKAPIIIFDEATSNLDNESEKKVQESLGLLLKGRTALIIAHRLSTVKFASRIAVLEGGKIIEQGTHNELMGKNGVYSKMNTVGSN